MGISLGGADRTPLDASRPSSGDVLVFNNNRQKLGVAGTTKKTAPVEG